MLEQNMNIKILASTWCLLVACTFKNSSIQNYALKLI